MSLHPDGCQHDGYKSINAKRSPTEGPLWCGECFAVDSAEQETNALKARIAELERMLAGTCHAQEVPCAAKKLQGIIDLTSAELGNQRTRVVELEIVGEKFQKAAYAASRERDALRAQVSFASAQALAAEASLAAAVDREVAARAQVEAARALCDVAIRTRGHGLGLALEVVAAMDGAKTCTQVHSIPPRVQLLAASLLGWAAARSDEGHPDKYILPGPNSVSFNEHFCEPQLLEWFGVDFNLYHREDFLDALWLVSSLYGMRLEEYVPEHLYTQDTGPFYRWKIGDP